MLRSIRVRKHALKGDETCASVLERVKKATVGSPFDPKQGARFQPWGSWDDDRDAVVGCDEFPCKIKFDRAETLAIAAKPSAERLPEVLSKIDARVTAYLASSERKGYDRVEPPLDPWKIFPKHGHVLPPELLAGKPSLFLRKINFGGDVYRPIRQVLDERVFSDAQRVIRISRDIYTAHYFDGWGEWFEARCEQDGKSVLFLHELLLEFDLLKRTDLISKIARPKMRQGVDQESLKYQKARAAGVWPSEAD
jgi:hypothetical protein